MQISSTKRLLVIDQDVIGDSFLTQTLGPSGYQINKVNSSSEALHTSQNWNPDMIIFNLMQPSTNGWQLCSKIREYSRAPILVLAAVSDPILIAHWLDAGADDFLTKPLSADILIAHIQKLTRRSSINRNLTPQTVI
jgi:DNA-binding response OmpR family regulator